MLFQFQNGLMVGEEISVLECLVLGFWGAAGWHVALGPLISALAHCTQVDPHSFISLSSAE